MILLGRCWQIAAASLFYEKIIGCQSKSYFCLTFNQAGFHYTVFVKAI